MLSSYRMGSSQAIAANACARAASQSRPRPAATRTFGSSRSALSCARPSSLNSQSCCCSHERGRRPHGEMYLGSNADSSCEEDDNFSNIPFLVLVYEVCSASAVLRLVNTFWSFSDTTEHARRTSAGDRIPFFSSSQNFKCDDSDSSTVERD
jgi:hypothetical protein